MNFYLLFLKLDLVKKFPIPILHTDGIYYIRI